jgi:two-component sensor histidine kinase
VELRVNPGQVLSLRVADDGVGFPADFDIHKTKSLGLQLVHSLVAQLDGSLDMELTKGSDFRVSFGY